MTTTQPFAAARTTIAAVVFWCLVPVASAQQPPPAQAPGWVAAPAAAAPPAAPPSAPGQADASATLTLGNGSQLRGNVLLYAPGQQVVLEYQGQTLVVPWTDLRALVFAAAPSALPRGLPLAGAPGPDPLGIEPADPLRAQRLMRLDAQREQLRASNRRWAGPAVGLGLGALTMFAGAVALVASKDDSYDPDCHSCYDRNVTSRRVGLALLAIGPALVLVFMPMLIVRVSRASRLKRVERSIQRLGGSLALVPAVAPRYAGLAAGVRF